MNKTYVVGSGKVCRGKCGGLTYVDCDGKKSALPPQQGSNYNTCVELICPQCKKSVHLLGQAVTSDCQQCLDRNSERINQCSRDNYNRNTRQDSGSQLNPNSQHHSGTQRNSNVPTTGQRPPSTSRQPSVSCRNVCVQQKVSWHNVSDGRHSLCAGGIPKAPGPGLQPPKCEKSVSCIKWQKICK